MSSDEGERSHEMVFVAFIFEDGCFVWILKKLSGGRLIGTNLNVVKGVGLNVANGRDC